MAKQKGITVEQLYLDCAKMIKAGNGKRHIMISNDDEGNGYHELFYGFSPNLQNEVNFGDSWAEGMLPYGVTATQAKKSYIILEWK